MPPDLIEPPDLIDALTRHLGDQLGVPVVGQTPSPRPETWVLIEAAGGVASIGTEFPMLTCDVWAPTKREAGLLAGRVWDLLVRRLPPVVHGIRILRRVPVSAPSYQPLHAAGGYRYRVTVQIKHQIKEES